MSILIFPFIPPSPSSVSTYPVSLSVSIPALEICLLMFIIWCMSNMSQILWYVEIQWPTQLLSTRSSYFSGKLFLPFSSGLCYYLTFTCISHPLPHLFLPSFEFFFPQLSHLFMFFPSLRFVLPSFEFFSHFIFFFSSTKKVQCSVSTKKTK